VNSITGNPGPRANDGNRGETRKQRMAAMKKVANAFLALLIVAGSILASDEADSVHD